MNQLYSRRFGDALADSPEVPKLEEAKVIALLFLKVRVIAPLYRRMIRV